MKKDFFIQFKSALISKDMIKTIVGGYGNPSGTGGSGRKCCSEVRRNFQPVHPIWHPQAQIKPLAIDRPNIPNPGIATALPFAHSKARH